MGGAALFYPSAPQHQFVSRSAILSGAVHRTNGGLSNARPDRSGSSRTGASFLSSHTVCLAQTALEATRTWSSSYFVSGQEHPDRRLMNQQIPTCPHHFVLWVFSRTNAVTKLGCAGRSRSRAFTNLQTLPRRDRVGFRGDSIYLYRSKMARSGFAGEWGNMEHGGSTQHNPVIRTRPNRLLGLFLARYGMEDGSQFQRPNYLGQTIESAVGAGHRSAFERGTAAAVSHDPHPVYHLYPAAISEIKFDR